jgi:hypothetical protein
MMHGQQNIKYDLQYKYRNLFITNEQQKDQHNITAAAIHSSRKRSCTYQGLQ